MDITAKLTQDDVNSIAIAVEAASHDPKAFAIKYMSEEIRKKAANTPDNEFQKKFRKAFSSMEMSWGTMF
jgi:hypothetical protein